MLRAALSISIASAWNWSEKRGHWNEKDIVVTLVRTEKTIRFAWEARQIYSLAVTVGSASGHEGVVEREYGRSGTLRRNAFTE